MLLAHIFAKTRVADPEECCWSIWQVNQQQTIYGEEGFCHIYIIFFYTLIPKGGKGRKKRGKGGVAWRRLKRKKKKKQRMKIRTNILL